MKIVKHESVADQNLGEIYQDMNLRTALLLKEEDQYVRITPFVKCRDFLVDIYSMPDTKFTIYGMKPPAVKPDSDVVRLALNFPDAKAKECFERNLKTLIHPIEKANHYILTTYEVIDDEHSVIHGEKKWLDSCLSLSLYTSLLRVSCYPIKNSSDWIKEMSGKDGIDGGLISSIHKETWDKILGNLSFLNLPDFCGFENKQDFYGVHHNSGFYSVFGTHCELSISYLRKNKHWKYFNNLGFKMYNHDVEDELDG